LTGKIALFSWATLKFADGAKIDVPGGCWQSAKFEPISAKFEEPGGVGVPVDGAGPDL
jgi:hypothetical protein